MKSKSIVMSLFAAAAVATGCASHEPRKGGDPDGLARNPSNDNYYAVVESIDAARPPDASVAGTGAYALRLRFDDGTYRTVTQADLDGLRIGDGVRIESGRVRRYR